MLKRMTNTSVLKVSAQQASKEQIAGCFWQFPKQVGKLNTVFVNALLGKLERARMHMP